MIFKNSKSSDCNFYGFGNGRMKVGVVIGVFGKKESRGIWGRFGMGVFLDVIFFERNWILRIYDVVFYSRIGI